MVISFPPLHSAIIPTHCIDSTFFPCFLQLTSAVKIEGFLPPNSETTASMSGSSFVLV